MLGSSKQASAEEAFCYKLSRKDLFAKKDFTALFNSGRKKHTALFILFYQALPALSQPHLGIVVSKKHAKTSIKRNLVKRLAREHYRLNQHEIKAWQVLFVSKKGLDVATREQINQELKYLFEFVKLHAFR